MAIAKLPRHCPADLANKLLKTTRRNSNSFSWQRSLFSFSIIAAGVYFIGWVPLPQHVYCRAELSAANPVRVYAASAGKLLSIASSNQTVDAGEIIGQLENSDLNRKLKIKQTKLIQGRAQLRQLELRVNEQPNLVAQIGEMKNRIKSLIDESSVIDHEVTQLQILAPISGIVIPADARPLRMVQDSTRIRRDGLGKGLWEGTLSESKNRGCYVPRSEHLLTIVDPADHLILLTVGESEMDSVEPGQHVSVRFEMAPDSRVEGSVIKILRQETTLLGDPNETNPDRNSLGQPRPMESNYRVEVGHAAVPNKVLIGSTGSAKIEVRPATIFLRLKRLIRWSLETRAL